MTTRASTSYRVCWKIRAELFALGLGVLSFLLPLSFGQVDQSDVHVTPGNVTEHSSTQGTLPSREGTASFRAKANLVLVPATVTDQRGRFVIGLEKSNFDIYDRHKLQVIQSLSSEDAPISLGIILDTSSSMYSKMERTREALLQLLRSSNPNDEFFLIRFADRPSPLVDFTSSIETIQNELARAAPDGATALLDAVYLGVDKMKHARYERKILLIVSDGGENHSRYTAKNVISVLRESRVQVFAIGIFDDAPRTTAERLGPDLLSSMTDISGGRVVPIRSLKRIGEETSRLAIELRNHYLIAYRPNDMVHDGKWHAISVQIKPPREGLRLRVHARGGYYAPAQ